MKKIFFLKVLFICLICISDIRAQEQDSAKFSDWNLNAEMDFYFTDPFFILPILSADKSSLHLEARYNYEDLKTVSGWIGYNFSGGSNFEYLVTMMVGGIIGRTNGIAPGIELTFDYFGFELYSEMEYVFDFETRENNFFYGWNDFTYSPLDWLWFGVSAQTTKLYKCEWEFERGLIVGAGLNQFEVTGYLYNLGSDDSFIILAISYSL